MLNEAIFLVSLFYFYFIGLLDFNYALKTWSSLTTYSRQMGHILEPSMISFPLDIKKSNGAYCQSTGWTTY